MTYAAIPTVYADVQFRSRLEARWACFFDLLGWRWEYEPFDLNGWIPDFVLRGATHDHLIEVKPALDQYADAYDKAQKACEGTKWAWLTYDQARDVYFRNSDYTWPADDSDSLPDLNRLLYENAQRLGTPIPARLAHDIYTPQPEVVCVSSPTTREGSDVAYLPTEKRDDWGGWYSSWAIVHTEAGEFDLVSVSPNGYECLLTGSKSFSPREWGDGNCPGMFSYGTGAAIERLWKQAGNTVQWKAPR